ncbi:MAG: ABC transporter permease [Candidatus Thermoplasmatota archaeon]|nr:ABC transporter permease [Candidatus Thermoplasmatota archaeon]
MSKKTIVEFSRYPLSFGAIFLQIFLMVLMFMFAVFAFSSPTQALDSFEDASLSGWAEDPLSHVGEGEFYRVLTGPYGDEPSMVTFLNLTDPAHSYGVEKNPEGVSDWSAFKQIQIGLYSSSGTTADVSIQLKGDSGENGTWWESDIVGFGGGQDTLVFNITDFGGENSTLESVDSLSIRFQNADNGTIVYVTQIDMVLTPQGARLAGVMMYGFVIFIFLSFILWEVGFSIREEQFRGTLESLYLSPANKFSNLISRVFAIFMWITVIASIALVVVSNIAGGLPLNNVALAFLILFLTVSGILGMAFFVAGLTIRIKESAALLVNFLQFFFMIFCAAFFPFRALPSVVVDYVSRWIPVSYGVDAFRSVLIGLPEGYPELLPFEAEMVVVVLFGILSPLLGYLYYRHSEKKARIQGTLGEY